MCGIGGIVRFNKKTNHIKQSAILLNRLIAHRGPDDEGYMLYNSHTLITAYAENTPNDCINYPIDYSPKLHINEAHDDYDIVLTHRRLSIIELNPVGHQPMSIDEGNYWIVFNGEIYNYLELRKELQALGCTFRSESDTEVVLQAYKVWGKECLHKFNGMWAFVIFDKNKKTLYGARDRFGVKPFYFYHDKDVFAFASEQKALIKMPFISSGIRPEAVFDYFVKNEIEYEPQSFFRHIIELFPGHNFELNHATGYFAVEQYYRLYTNPDYRPFEENKFNVAKEELYQRLFQAVQLRMRADVPVGACLSGGIDSSSIVALINTINENTKSEHKTNLYTASYNDIAIDESPYAARMAENINGTFHRVFPQADELLHDLENLIYCQDVPIWSTSTYAQYRLMQKVKETGIKVVLDGQGGDELFAGYHNYYYNYWRELLGNYKFKTLFTEMKGFLPFPHNMLFFLKQHLRYSTIHKMPSFVQFQINRNYFGDLYYLNPVFLNQYKKRLQTPPAPGNLNQMLHTDFNSTRLKAYLKCEDRCSMWHSVESRTPFADDIHLIEYAFQLPSSFKIHKGINKYILRQSMRNKVPDIILNRKDKMGFTTPNAQWINAIKEAVRPYFNNELKDYFDMNKLNRDYNRLFDTKTADATDTRTFKFIAFAVWKKTFGL